MTDGERVTGLLHTRRDGDWNAFDRIAPLPRDEHRRFAHVQPRAS
jgi:hypothetical protein